MKIIKKISELQKYSLDAKRQGHVVGLVPTMGFLHEGHLSLIKTAKDEGSDIVIVSVFVNPTQFGPTEDFDKYPRDLERDVMLCEKAGADVVFAPDACDMYQEKNTCWVEETLLSRNLCGLARPTHFRGVTTVVAKLFNAALPDIAVFGRKDAQQAAVIKRMVRDLNFPVKIIIAPIIREKDGLAMSSRNKYLSDDERMRALVISRSLFNIAKDIAEGRATDLEKACLDISNEIEKAGGRIDYVECVDAETMQKFDNTKKPSAVSFAVAAYFGKTRLIDNIVCELP